MDKTLVTEGIKNIIMRDVDNHTILAEYNMIIDNLEKAAYKAAFYVKTTDENLYMDSLRKIFNDAIDKSISMTNHSITKKKLHDIKKRFRKMTNIEISNKIISSNKEINITIDYDFKRVLLQGVLI